MLEVPESAEMQPQPPQEGLAWSAPKSNDFHENRRFGEWRFGGPVRVPDTPLSDSFAPPTAEPEPPAGATIPATEPVEGTVPETPPSETATSSSEPPIPQMSKGPPRETRQAAPVPA